MQKSGGRKSRDQLPLMCIICHAVLLYTWYVAGLPGSVGRGGGAARLVEEEVGG